MIILVDMDDTLEHLLDAWVLALNKKYGLCVSCDDVTSWDIDCAFPGLTHEQVHSVIKEPGFWKTVKPFKGAAEVLKGFMDEGHSVYIVTAAYYENLAEKMNDLLFKYYPFLSWKQVIIASNKQMVKGDVLIDDGVHNLEGGDFIKILMDAPHNRYYDETGSDITRVNDWAEIKGLISKIAKEPL